MRPEPVWKKASRSGQANARVEAERDVPDSALVSDAKSGGLRRSSASPPVLSRASSVPSSTTIQWRTSSRSAQGSECVEVGRTTGFTAVRDSTAPTGPALVLAPSAFASFLGSVKAGRFDRS